MATRFYLPSSGATPVTPAFSTWTETGGADRLRMVTSRTSSAFTNKTRAHTATAANSTFLSRMYVSDALAPQTISPGTVKGTIRALESATNDNLDAMRLTVRVVSNNGLTFRSPNLYGPVNGTVAELNTTLRAKRLAVGGGTNSVTALTGDRIVIEIGTTNTTLGSSLSDSISYGDNSVTDLGDNETDTAANNPFVEFSQTLVFHQDLFLTTTASLATITESIGSVRVLAPRTVAQTLGNITNDGTNAVASSAQHNRNAIPGDTLGAITEGIAGSSGGSAFLLLLSGGGTVAAGLPRLGAFHRSPADSLSTTPTVTALGSESIAGFDNQLNVPSSGLSAALAVGTLVVIGIVCDASVSVVSVDSLNNVFSIIELDATNIHGAIAYSRLTDFVQAGDQFTVVFSLDCYAAGTAIALTGSDGSPLDVSVSAGGTAGTSFSSGALVTAARTYETLVEVMVHTDGLATTSPFAFTDGATLDGEVESGAGSVHIGHRAVTAKGSYTGTATINAGEPNDWIAMTAAFKVGSGGIDNELRRSAARTVSQTLATLTEAASRLLGAGRSGSAVLAGFIWGQDSWASGAYASAGITESVGRTGVVAAIRAIADSLSSITEAVVGIRAVTKTVSDTVGATTEAVTRVVSRVRTSADSVATISEAVSRGVTAFTRALADTASSISEAVVGIRSGVNNLTRTVADSLATLTESVRSNRWTVTASETITGIIESVSASLANHQFTATVAQTMGAISEAVTRGTSSFGRAAAETLGAISEAVVAVKSGIQNLTRTVAETLGAISEATTRIGTFGRTSADTLGAISEAVVRAAAALVRSTSQTLGSITEAVVKGATAWLRTVAETVGAISESVANGSQSVGGVPPAVTAFFHSVARATGYSPTPKGSGENPKPKDK